MTDLLARGIAAQALRAGMVLGQSAEAASHTGTTGEVTLATIPVAAGLLGLNGQLVIEALWSVTNSANIKTPRIRVGGVAIRSPSLTTAASFNDRCRIANRNNAASQIIQGNSATVYGATTSAAIPATIDTGAAFNITLTGQLASAGETITLESWLVLAYPRN